ncbi:potassium/proton antiporter [Ectothiorhodospiraceae bacterium 2226]|nr:potassium/proton antiporter [Ectothiorhodospiraceae bacterium 2226]
MDFSNQIILIAGLLLLLSVFATVLSARVGAPLLLVFLVLGMLVGEEGPGGVLFDDIQLAHLVGSLALAVILFDGGLRTEAASFRVGLRPAVTLATLGVVLTAALTGAFATWVFDLHWIEGLLIGAIVGSTDAAAVFSLLHANNLELKQRVASTLEIESGSNDPMAIFLTIALVEILAAGGARLDWSLAQTFALQMGVGALAGLGGGWLLSRLINRIVLLPGLYPILALAGGLVIFGVAAVLEGSGFLAAYLAGLVVGNRRLQGGQNIRRFHDGIAWLAQIGMFLILGLLVTPSELLPIAPQALLLAAALILVARPLAVVLCLLPFRFPWREHVFISWVGLRGAVPIILGIFPLLAGLEGAQGYFNAAFFVVLVSLLVQGWTVAPAARLLGLEVPPRTGVVQRVELDIPGQQDLELVGYRLERDSPVVQRDVPRAALPEGVQLASVVRGGRPLPTCDLASLTEGDFVYLLATPENVAALDRLFGAAAAPPRLEERQFFGDFVLDGEARMADVAMMYGLAQAPDMAASSLSEYLSGHLKARPVVGDRLRLGHVEFVVREVEGGRIRKVGLKIVR